MSRYKKVYDPYTDEEKKEIRLQHRGLLDAALHRLRDPEGMARFLETLHIHGETHTPSNLALIALQAPGELVGTYGQWVYEVGCPVKENMVHKVDLTGRTFFPDRYFTAGQVGFPMPEMLEACPVESARLASIWSQWPDHSTKGLDAWVAENTPMYVPGDTVLDVLPAAQSLAEAEAEMVF